MFSRYMQLKMASPAWKVFGAFEKWAPEVSGPLGPASRRSWKVFGPGKPQQKSQTLSLQSCSFHIFLVWTNFPFMQSFMPIHFSVFKIRTIENGFASPKHFRAFEKRSPEDKINAGSSVLSFIKPNRIVTWFRSYRHVFTRWHGLHVLFRVLIGSLRYMRLARCDCFQLVLALQ